MSTKESVKAAAAAGSAEVTPHHLFLSCEQFSPGDTIGKVNPPLRSEKERKALWTAWDKISVIASDHAPHTPAEKQVPFHGAPYQYPRCRDDGAAPPRGRAGEEDHLPDIIRKTSQAPAELLGITSAGFATGLGGFCIVPKESVPIDPDTLHSKCGFSPFAGLPAVFPRIVALGGTVVYEDGEFGTRSPPGSGNGYYP